MTLLYKQVAQAVKACENATTTGAEVQTVTTRKINNNTFYFQIVKVFNDYTVTIYKLNPLGWKQYHNLYKNELTTGAQPLPPATYKKLLQTAIKINNILEALK